MTTYQINGLPRGWAGAPPFVVNWLKQLKKIPGEKVGDKILFKIDKVKEALKNLKVPHVANALEDKDLEYDETNCTEEN